MSTDTPPAPEVHSVTRAFALLEALANFGGEGSLSEIAGVAGLPSATAHRLLGTLAALGYVRHCPNRRYALGSALIGLGRKAVPPLALASTSILTRLEDQFHETTNLAVLDGDLVLYAAQVPSRYRMRMFTEVGRRVLPHSTGVGKAMLSMMPEPRARDLVARTGLPRFTSTTLVDVDALVADLRISRHRGFAADDGEQEVGVRCIAVAVPGLEQPTGLSVSGPATRITDAVIPDVVTALQAAARELAAAPA